MKLKQAIQLTFENRESWRNGSGAVTARINTNHVLRILGNIDATEITGSHFNRLVRELRNEGKANGTINRIQAALSAVLKELQYDGYDVRTTSYKRLREKPGKPEFYSVEELEKLLTAASELKDAMLLHDSILFSYRTGCRQGELLKLCSSEVDLDEMEVTFLDTKNGEDHVLPINPEIQEVLERRIHYATGPILFSWRDGDQLLEEFKVIRDALGISSKKAWHTIRHTTATHMLEKGTQMRTIMKVLNHKSINTTLRYAKTTDSSLKAAMAVL